MNLDHIDIEEVFNSIATDLYYGFCINKNCGVISYGIEPDVEESRCDSCGEFSVYGAEVLLLKLG